MPGATTVTGSVPPASNVVERAEDGFGQGKVVASPFGMALVASTVASGKMPTPTLLRGDETKSDTVDPDPVDGAVLTSIRAMMQEVTARTPATGRRTPTPAARRAPPSSATARTRTAGSSGYRGDLAFAVLLTDAG